MINKKKLAFGLSRLIKGLLLALALNTLLLVTAEYTNVNALGPWLKANVTFSLSILPAPQPAPQGTSNPRSFTPEPASSEASALTISTPTPSTPSAPTTIESPPVPIAISPSSEPLPPELAPENPPENPTESAPALMAVPVETPTVIPTQNTTAVPATTLQPGPATEAFPVPPTPTVTQTPPETTLETTELPKKESWMTRLLVTSQFILSFTIMTATAALYLVI